MEIAGVYRGADGFLAKYSSITSPLLRAQSFAEVQDWTERLTGWQQNIAARREKLLARVQAIDGVWVDVASRSNLLAELETICRWLGFYFRWNGQIQERLLRLML